MSVKTLYRTSATATGGRDGSARSEDGRLEARLSTPKELGAPAGTALIPSNCSQPATPPAS